MRRPILITLIGLGAVIPVAGAGVFAASSDTASSTGNFVETGEFSVDLKIGTAATTSEINCENAVDAIPARIESVGKNSGVIHNPLQTGEPILCVKNVGDADATVTLVARNIAETELGCSPGEAAVENLGKCGNPGEVGASLALEVTRWNCKEHTNLGVVSTGTVSSLSINVGVLGKNEVGCYSIAASLPNVLPVIAQSDRIQWDFAFEGTSL